MQIEAVTGGWFPVICAVAFLLSSLVIIWRLEGMSRRGVEGTVLGTLFMPYFSGLGNLIFVAVMLRQNGPPGEIAVNSLVNNLTNLCLLLTIPALIWGMKLAGPSKKKKDRVEAQLHRLSLCFTLIALVFFTLVVWALGRNGEIDRYDGITLVGLFLFWQCFHVVEVLKENTRRGSAWSKWIFVDVGVILAASYLTLLAVDGLVGWLLARETGWMSAGRLGIITGLLMVLSNAVLAFHYASRRRADIVYSSQVGDAHICIPLCIGLFAIFQPVPITPLMANALLLLAGVGLVHLVCIGLARSLPRIIAAALVVAFGALVVLQAGWD